eukprot:TRINITY_DN291_c0_g1_i2.p2 TRINITY_DN291_c0_g1~~TRINITY_DN291_c0_g1_i2.p2  ORF type:complete len:163 (-),score=0.58 TRINITY_DN291_c0_g1_i2:139-627(-)
MKMQMKSFLAFISLLFISEVSCQKPCVCSPQSSDPTADCSCSPILFKSQYLSLSDDQLYQQGLFGIGQCKIQRNTGFGFCDLYVASGITGTFGSQTYIGYPLSQLCRGTGCVKAPDFPKRVGTCWYSDPEYGAVVNSRVTDYCSDKGIANAAAQLGDAIMKV